MTLTQFRISALTGALVAWAGSASATTLLLPSETTPFIGALTVAGVGRLSVGFMLVRRRKTAITRRLMVG